MKYNLMNSERYKLSKRNLCNKMNKETAIPPIKPNKPNDISKIYAFSLIKKLKK